MTVAYRILETRRPATDLVLGYVAADFTFPDRPTVSLYIGVLVERGDDGWRIAHYQASSGSARASRSTVVHRPELHRRAELAEALSRHVRLGRHQPSRACSSEAHHASHERITTLLTHARRQDRPRGRCRHRPGRVGRAAVPGSNVGRPARASAAARRSPGRNSGIARTEPVRKSRGLPVPVVCAGTTATRSGHRPCPQVREPPTYGSREQAGAVAGSPQAARAVASGPATPRIHRLTAAGRDFPQRPRAPAQPARRRSCAPRCESASLTRRCHPGLDSHSGCVESMRAAPARGLPARAGRSPPRRARRTSCAASRARLTTLGTRRPAHRAAQSSPPTMLTGPA